MKNRKYLLRCCRQRIINYGILVLLSILALSTALFSQQNQLDSLLRDADVSGIQLIYANQVKSQEIDLGVVKDGSEKRIDSRTIFQAASLSKCVFAYMVLRLCDRGIIHLDTPLLHYIGHYERFDQGNPAYEKITARMVLRHTTGLPNWGNDSGVHLIFTPDSMYSYSGEGYLFLQKVIEKKLNKPLDKIMEEEVFVPLNMHYSGYVWKPAFDSIASMDHNTPEEKKNYINPNAAFSLLTNAGDYNTFLIALLEGKGLKSETRQLIFQKSSSGKQFKDPTNKASPYIYWGLGVGLLETQKGLAIWHWGDNGAYKCFFIVYPSTKERIIYFTHSANGLDMTSSILNLFIGKQKYWTSTWLGYEFESPDVIHVFRLELEKRGFNQANELYEELKMKDPDFSFSENDLNKLGYQLLNHKKNEQAIEIFKLNISLHPESANVYDSMGEAYEKAGNKPLAIENYKRSLELDPANDNATAHIKNMEAK